MRAGTFFSLFVTAGLIALAVAIFVAPKLREPEPEASISVAVTEPAAPTTPYAHAAILKKEADGHFWANSDVDGFSVKFMIDTGASTVVLTYRDAQRIGLDPKNLDYSWSIRTAGGEVKGASVLLPSIRIGQVEIENVEAMVLRDGLDQSLLGMTFLGELYSYEFKQNSLIIRQ